MYEPEEKTHDEQIFAASAKYPTVPLPEGQKYEYGTAGFRMRSELLEGISFRVGLLASLRSRDKGGKAIGVMITASHNPAADNGVKIVDPLGEMLESEWEGHATYLVNAPDVVHAYKRLVTVLKIDLTAKAKVIYGRDTRPSGHTLARALAAGCEATECESVDYRILTTPQLHYLVRATNTYGTREAYGEVSEVGYYQKMSEAFLKCLSINNKKCKGTLIVDCANGVGGPKLGEFLKYIPREKIGVDIKVVNDDVLRPEILNLDCGADFVKTKQRAPPVPPPKVGPRCCSLDGDADRLIYYFMHPDRGFIMLDGDRISSLVADFITELLESAGYKNDLRLGVVQTAYANGASTKYLRERLQLPVACTPTGVKHLHHVAASFDIGVYFEANGHGTVLFNRDAQKTFAHAEPNTPGQKDALDMLSALCDLVNQTVGDAISDMLLVEVVLAHRNWSLEDWLLSYQDLPNRQLKVEVRDKNMFVTSDAERKLVHPQGIQPRIDAIVAKYKLGRAFARASGTENVCRVYAEAASRTEADELANLVAQEIKTFGGVRG